MPASVIVIPYTILEISFLGQLPVDDDEKYSLASLGISMRCYYAVKSIILRLLHFICRKCSTASLF